MANRVRIDEDTVFNPETGELITTSHTGVPSSKPVKSDADSSWIGCGLLLLITIAGLLIYTFVKQNNDKTGFATAEPSAVSADSSREEFPYGAGNGKVTIYKTSDECVDVEIYVDGKWFGRLNKTFKDGTPSCGDTATIFAVLEMGDHRLTAKDRNGTTWDFRFRVIPGICMSEKIDIRDGVRPNPYGEGYGQVTICNTLPQSPYVIAYIDDILVATFTKYYTEPGKELCGINDEAAFSKVLSNGEHRIKFINAQNDEWTEMIEIREGECTFYDIKEKESIYPYGKGNGQLTIYHNCKSCRYVSVYLDNNEYAGLLRTALEVYESPDCGESNDSAITKILPAGVYRISAKDLDGNKWESYVYVKRNECKTYALENLTRSTNAY